jgi:hypothetical protein
MNSNQFAVPPGHHAIVSYDFKDATRETDVDVLIAGSYQNSIEGRIARRLTYANSRVGPTSPFDTGRNAAATDKVYDVHASYKVVPDGHEPWHDFGNCGKSNPSPNVFEFTFGPVGVHTPGSAFAGPTSVKVRVTIG